ncbi:MAG TPA: phosphate ABC transporter permease subunit PstC [Acetobacteraceae bacterium]|nr:phosphate ABC transporter permease subunit PstC [Acetobacteraceae bacterium]
MSFRRLLALFAGVLPASLVAVILFLAIYSWPAVRFNGLGFVVRTTWNLGNTYGDPIVRNGVAQLPGAQYGILFLIVGTLLSTLIALLLAVPTGVGAAIFLAEAVPGRLRLWLSFLVELLAAVPSVVFGLWGYAVLIPLLGQHVFPVLGRLLGWIPIFAPPYGSGYGLLTAGVVLSLMIVPLIAATLRDAILAEPMVVREAAAALGATRFETVWKVVLPGVRKILIGVTILATGRALGETMAVLMVSGNALNYLPGNIYSPISTMAAFIVSQLDSALQDPTGLAVRSLAEVALVLSVISVGVNAMARLVLYRAGLRGARV